MVLWRFVSSIMQRIMPTSNSPISQGLILLISSIYQFSLIWVSWDWVVYALHTVGIKGILNSLGQEESLSCLCPR